MTTTDVISDHRALIKAEHASTLASYRARPDNIRENAGQEQAIVQGGYREKQVQELIQNAVDALGPTGGLLQVVLTADALYVANEGRPFNAADIRTLLHSNMSDKRDEQIGRFGLGFKSVLQVSDSPQIFSGNFGIGFDAARSRHELELIASGLAAYPVLRLPYSLDPAGERSTDPVLDRLRRSSATTVRLPLRNSDVRKQLSTQLSTFPHHFLLFTPKVRELRIENDVTNESTSWKAIRSTTASGNSTVTIESDDSSEEWLVVATEHRPSDRALKDAGSVHARESITVSWAVPTGVGPSYRTSYGLWNYFPTKTEITIPGIINAAFKMNDDRVSVLEDLYNEEILTKSIGRLMLAAIPELRTEEDPAGHFLFLPARGREDAPWIRSKVIEPLTEFITKIPFIPNLDGELRRIEEVHSYPYFRTDADEALAAWRAYARSLDVTEWVHEKAVEGAFRVSVIRRMESAKGVLHANYGELVSGLATPGTVDSYVAAIKFAHLLISGDHQYERDLIEQVRSARIIPYANGETGSLSSRMYFPADTDSTDAGVLALDLVSADGISPILRAYGARPLDGTAHLERLLTDALSDPDDGALADRFWDAASQYPAQEVIETLRTFDPTGELTVPTNSRTRHPRHSAWRVGPLLDRSRPDDADLTVAVDHPFFTADMARALDIPSKLPASQRSSIRAVDDEWREMCREEVNRYTVEHLGATATASSIENGDVFRTPRLRELDRASLEARASATEELLARPQSQVTIYFEANYPGDTGTILTRKESLQVDSPDVHWIKRFGALRTHYGTLPTSACCGEIEGIPTELLPHPKGIGADFSVDPLNLPRDLTNAGWTSLLMAAESALEVNALHTLYGHAASTGVRGPAELVAVVSGDSVERLPVSECVIPGDAPTAEHIGKHTEYGIVRPGQLILDTALEDAWKLSYRTILFTTSIRHIPSESSRIEKLRSRFPYLSDQEGKLRKLNSYSLVAGKKLGYVTVNNFDDIETVEEGHALLVDALTKSIYHRETLNKSGLVTQLLDHVGSSRTAADVLASMRAAEEDARREDYWEHLRSLGSDQDRILALIGTDGLREIVPPAALAMLATEGIEVTDSLLFRMAQSIHGSDLWAAVRASIPESDDASAWVKEAKRKELTEIGFSPELFGTAEPKKPAREEVLGPITFRELHEYQKESSEKVLRMLSARPGANKGVLQLPTGAGKTRVAVESLIKHIRSRKSERDVIVWIAQSDELCEQAVEAWSSAWPALGIGGERLVLGRLWDGRTVVEEDVRLHVIVATIQTLTRIADADKKSPTATKYHWLQRPEVVVIDEAHGATTTSYTTVLKWFHRSTGQQGRPLLGLTATPFRGTNEKETEALVNRFGGNLIEPSSSFTAENAHEFLQARGVLAQVRQEELQGSVLKQRHNASMVATQGRGGRKMLDDRIDLDSVGLDEARNQRILRHIEAHRETFEHAIVFAASVKHAQALAAVLDARGIPSAAIWGGTSMSHRRRLIKQFRDGEIQVLTNFDVLSQGFDAPKVDSVYLCRPTFSPNRYIQMIGRGLRGPLNDGSKEVLIVNIRDNLENFGSSLAYTEFSYLWDKSRNGA
ncbi:sacsin N-terminal ATP-binding-like domain-containing protein [Brachybacterium tyrofermentans]|uniref:sacsin N-terminal ATP-binding-like domain-containing protein n=1 Tax=Brachybacterium tyrofermentans TaxID=47848 RepID=UPI003FD552F1